MMSGKRSLVWRNRHNGHSRSSEVEAEDEEDEDEVEATPGAESAEAWSCCWHISECTLSTLAMPSTPAASARDLRDLGSPQRRRNSDRSEMRRFLGVFRTEGRLTDEAAEGRSLSDPCC